MEQTSYTVVVRQEGRRTVFDVIDEKGHLWRKGLSLAGLKETFEQIAEAE